MSDPGNERLPRVIIRKAKDGASIEINFRPITAELGDQDESAKELIDLADDWTSFCIASLQFVPAMASAGFFIVDRKIDEDLFKFLKEICISQEETNDPEVEETKFSFIVHEDDVHQVAKKMATTTQMIRAADAVSRSTLGSLIAEFDFFISRLLTICASKFPEKFYDQSDKISLQELSSAKSIEDVIRKRITGTVSSKLRESHSEIIEWIFDNFDLASAKAQHKSNAIFKDFLEVCQRRHILTHNGGIVNAEYIQKCEKAGFSKIELPEVGDRIEIDQKYMMRSAARVYLTGYFLLQLLFQKHFPGKARAAYANLLSTAHTFLESDLTKMCLRVCDFAEYSSKSFDQDLRLKFAINRALSCLFNPGLDVEEQSKQAKLVLCKYDWSVTTPIFDLALACVNRDFSNLIPLAKAAAAFGLGYNDARTFVVFREARRIEGFLDCFPRAPLLIEQA